MRLRAPSPSPLLPAALLFAALVFNAPVAFAGAQQYELLSASVRASLARAVNERASIDMADMDLRAWVRAMTPRVEGTYFGDEDTARGFLALARCARVSTRSWCSP